MPATAPLRHPKECRRRKCNNGEIPHATLRNSICIFEEKVLAKNKLQKIRQKYHNRTMTLGSLSDEMSLKNPVFVRGASKFV